ncbi:MAG: peptidylprolyl isomerase [Pseudomonadota bacterium]
MKKLLLSLAVGISLLSTPAPAFSATQEGIVAIVNDAVITMTDIRDRTELYLSGSRESIPPAQRKKMEQQILNRLIDEALQLQEAKKLGITVGEDDVTAGFADLSRQNGISPPEFRKRLSAAGVRIDSLYAQIRADVAWGQVVRKKLRPQVNISESEIDLALSQIARGSGKTLYHVAEIFLSVTDPAKEKDARSEADKLVTQLMKGASFNDMAREFSQAPGASGGGDLGWVQEGQMGPELDKALGKMKPNQISPPIRSAKGYHILFLRELRRNADALPDPDAGAAARKSGHGKNDEASREQLATKLGIQRLGQMAERYLRDLRASAFIDRRM